MVRKTTILVAAIAAASIGGLAAGGAAGLVKTPGGAAAPAPALQLAVNGAAEQRMRHGTGFALAPASRTPITRRRPGGSAAAMAATVSKWRGAAAARVSAPAVGASVRVAAGS